MKRLTITLLSLLAVFALAGQPKAHAQGTPTAKITFRTLVEEGGAVNIIFEPADKIKVTGAHSIIVDQKQAWEVDDQTITLEGPITYFDCNMSRIVEMQFENCNDLKYLCVSTNLLTQLNLTGLSGVEQVVANSTEINEVDLTGCTSLKFFECDAGKLTKINLPAATNLEKASLMINRLSTIDLSGLNKLKQIDLSQNNLGTINVSNLPALQEIRLSNNPLTDASFSECNALETLDLKHCKLTSFTAKGLDVLTDLTLNNNQLTKLTLEELPMLYSIDLASNNLSSVDFSKCNTNLNHIELNSNKFEGTFSLRDMPRLEYLSLAHNKISSFEIEGCLMMNFLNVQSNNLATLDLSGCTSDNFQEVYAGKNHLTSVKLGNHEIVSLPNNKLSTIDLSGCSRLKELDLSDNEFENIDFTGLKTLENVTVCHNKIGESNMDKLIATLYKYEGDEFGTPTLYAVETRSDLEGNLCSEANVAKAKEKNWRVYDRRTYAAYNGAKKCALTSKTLGKGGKILLNGKESLDVYTDTKVQVEVFPEEGYGLDSLWYRSKEIFKDQAFWVTREGEVTAKFTDKICKVVLERFGHGILKLDGEKFDLKRMPIGRTVRVIANIYDDEEYFRELASLKANGEDIMGERDIELKGDVRIVATFDWLGDGTDPYEGEYYSNIQEVTRGGAEASFVLYPNPAHQQLFIEGAATASTVAVYTLDGLRVLSAATDAEGRATLDVEGLAEGVYVVVAGNVAKRLIVRR